MIKYFILTFGFSIICTWSMGQESIVGKPIVCYHEESHAKTSSVHPRGYVPPGVPPQVLSVNELIYTNVPQEAMPAIQKASTIWAGLLESKVPIRINIIWAPLEGNAVASTRATRLFKGFSGAVRDDVWYPVALAEKITGEELNAGAADVEILLNENVNWYFGTDGQTPADAFDLVSVALHEIIHGLGFNSFARIEGERGILRDEGSLSIYDLLLETSLRRRLSTYSDHTTEMRSALTSNNIFIFSPTAAKFNKGNLPKVESPETFTPGSSLSHLDEESFPPGNPNSLMTPNFSRGESMHSPGNIVLGILADLGWDDSRHPTVKILAYPNPSNGIFRLDIPLDISSAEVSLFDVSGRVIKRKGEMKFSGPENQIDVSDVGQGIYILVIKTSGERVALKLIFL